jgi:uncharacterized protein (UPF0264 family)
MTRLLVSVRNGDEARVALAAGVDLIDVKEPARGSLGRASAAAIQDVLNEVDGRTPVSAALGELRDWTAEPRGNTATDSLAFAKLGLAGCSAISDWPIRWSNVLQSVEATRGAVAVIYADWRAAEAPSPENVLVQARRFGCGAVLVDTYHKQAGGLLHHWRLNDVQEVIGAAHAAGMLAVIAGSLDGKTIPQIAALSPDYVAVRGAACRGGRSGPLDRGLIEELRSTLATLPPNA